jgi:hypothetical protein
MNESAHRRKTLVIFALIIGFSIFVSNKVKNLSDTKLDRNEYEVSLQVKENKTDNDVYAQITEESGALYFEVDEDLNPVKEVKPEMILNESEVLGSSQQCDTGEFIYSSSKICSREIGEVDRDMRDDQTISVGERISRKSSITLTEVEVPPLLSGSFPMDSSVRQIYIDEDEKEDHWTLRPAGEMISAQVVAGNLQPNDTTAKELSQFAQEEGRTRKFGLTYGLGVEGDAEVQGDSTSNFTIYQYHDNNCGADCRNYPNPTPEHYLTNANILSHSINYPSYYKSQEETEEEELIDDCASDTQFLDMEITGTNAVGCTPSIFEVIANFFKRIINPKEAKDCSPLDPNAPEDDRDECISLASLVIIMESPWGSKQDCTDIVEGKCVTEYNDLRNGQFDVPTGGDNGKIYVLTNCGILVDGYAKKAKCAWDVDYMAEELEFQSNDNLPGEAYPEKMDYLDFHIKEAESREDPVFEM